MSLFKMNEKGNLGLAMAVVVIAFLSSVTMTGIALKDVVTTRMQQDGLQETHFLRYEAFRGLMACRATDYTGEGFILPLQQFEVTSSDSRTTYFMKSKIVKSNVTTGGGLYTTNGYTVKTLVTAKRGGGGGIVYSRNISPVKEYAEKDIRRSTFAGYHYFSDIDQSENADISAEAGRVYFYGPDVIYGKVHSNSDIWVEQAGAGTNQGWPTFWGDVSTAGIIQCETTIPYETIFKANYFEHSPNIEFSPTADLIRAHGQWLSIPLDHSVTVMVNVTGTSFSTWIGRVTVEARPESIDVYNPPYPPPAGAELFWYNLEKKDTLWTEGPPGTCSNGSIFSRNKTWIQGVFSGKQTWGCEDTLSLIGNIKLTGTNLGQPPDGGTSGINPNTTDFVGLVSEQRINIKYGYRDPEDSLRYFNTVGDDGNSPQGSGIWIYAAMCALGDGGGNPHKDGIFTFEYQHPHPSTPDLRIGNRVWTKIDLHTRIYPQTTAMPWPNNIDYPWFNPMWPELNPYMERGSIHLYGSVAQRRRGFVHRSNNDPANHTPAVWDFGAYKYGGPCVGLNYPGATGGGVGYKKDYHFDNRLSFTQPPDFPETHTRAGLTPFDSESWKFKKPPTNF